MAKKLITLPLLLLGIVLMTGCSKKESSFSEHEGANGQTSILDEDKTDKESEKTPSQPTETPKETEGEADLITYTNNDLGFEFKHPKNWIIDDLRTDAQTIVFIDENNMIEGEIRESVKVEDNAENLTLDEIVDQFIKEGKLTDEVVTKNFPIKVGGEETTKVETQAFNLDYYFFLHENKIYTIDTQGNLFNEDTLKTFKFTS